MPDYSVITSLCKELNITLAELMHGETDEKSIYTYDNEQNLSMIKEMQDLKNTKVMVSGFLLIIWGGVMMILSQIFGGRYRVLCWDWRLSAWTLVFIQAEKELRCFD